MIQIVHNYVSMFYTPQVVGRGSDTQLHMRKKHKLYSSVELERLA